MTQWRLIPYAEYSGATNMALDEATLEAHIKGLVPPTLRVYGFAPPAMTIGFSQKMNPDLVDSIQRRNIDVVRRPTGGRAVLHLNDFTYSFVGSDISRADGFLSTGITESYKQICAGLIEAFRELGIETELGASGVAYRHLQDCFMATAGCDLQSGGTKLIGSAQVRRRGVVLQHGSVPLNQDPALMPDLLGEPVPENRRHINLFDLLGNELPPEALEQAFVRGFSRAFGIEFVRGELIDAEKQVVEVALARELTASAASNV